MLLYLLLMLAVAVAVVLGVRGYLLKKSLLQANQQLTEICGHLEENRIITLAAPSRELEDLLVTVNRALAEVRQKYAGYVVKEKELKKQIENISHDLRTPLTSILGYLKLVDTSALSQEDQQAIEIVLRKATSLAALVSQFYDLSRLSSGDYHLEMERQDILRLLKECLTSRYHDFASDGLEVTVELPQQPVYVVADAFALDRIFSNLLQNAGKYAKSFLRIRCEVQPETVYIYFENNTDNLEEGDAERLFDRFYTVNPTRKEGSTGLGLAIAKGLAQEMAGALTAHTKAQEEDVLLSFVLAMKVA